MEETTVTRISCSSQGPNEDKKMRLERLLRELDALLTEEYDDEEDPGTIDDIEKESDRVAESVRKIVADKLLKKKQRNAQQQSGARQWTCTCGQPSRYAGMRSRQLVLRSGAHIITRAYFHCSRCHRGVCPLDGLLKLGQGQYSPTVAATMARMNSYLPDRKAAQELYLMWGIDPAVSTLQRYSRRAGAKIALEWKKQEEDWRHERLPESKQYPKRMVLTMDGVLIHVDGDWHEAKVGAAYELDSRTHAINTRFTASMEPSSEFGKRLPVLAHRVGVDHCRDVEVVGDGAPWIWQETAKYYPRSVQVLDYSHASEHLWTAAHARYGEGTKQAQDWAKELEDLMYDEKQVELREQIRSWQPHNQEKCKIRRRLLNYLLDHKARMAYRTLKESGYHIGSGVVEASCKNVVQLRMKQAGMRWSSRGAEAMLHSCAYYCSAGSEGFRNYV
jgi:Uncharacterised protein family (UPF0236)